MTPYLPTDTNDIELSPRNSCESRTNSQEWSLQRESKLHRIAGKAGGRHTSSAVCTGLKKFAYKCSNDCQKSINKYPVYFTKSWIDVFYISQRAISVTTRRQLGNSYSYHRGSPKSPVDWSASAYRFTEVRKNGFKNEYFIKNLYKKILDLVRTSEKASHQI